MSDKKSNKTRDLPVSLTALKILEIIKEESDIDHPISQAEIARRLGVDRKTVSRCLDVIGDIDGEIVRSKSGVYLIPSRSAFELSEIRLLIDSVLASKVISAEQTDAIVKKLSKLLNRHDRAHIRHIHSYKDWSKIDNKHVFWTVEVLDDAINKSCAVSFDYNEIGVDKLLHVLESYTVFPIQLAFSRGQYFLLAESDEECGIRSFRIDKITNAKIKERFKRKISERPIRDIASSYVEGHPYMSFGESERVTLIIEAAEIGRVFDVFGTRVSVAPCKENGEKYATMVEVSFVANTEDVYRFMLENADVSEIISPQHIRARIMKFGRAMHVRYLRNQSDQDLANYEGAISDKWQFSRNSWILSASDRAVRKMIEKNKTADRVWGISVDELSAETEREIAEYKNLSIIEFIDLPSLDLSVVESFPKLSKLTVSQRSRRKPKTELSSLKSLGKLSELRHMHFFNVRIEKPEELASATAVKALSLAQCEMPSIDFIKKMPELMRLDISGADISDLSALYSHKRLRVLTVDSDFPQNFDVEGLRMKNPRLRIEVHSRLIPTLEDPSVNHKIGD